MSEETETCPWCDDTGKTRDPVLFQEMDCFCVRELEILQVE